MKRTIPAIFLLLALISAQGCVFDDDKPANPDRGAYTLALSDSTMATYPGGGDVIILEMTPSEDFEGSVRLAVKGDTGLNARVNKSFVTKEKQITEIIIHPDSTVVNGSYKVKLTHTHGDITDTLTLPVTLSGSPYNKPYKTACEIILPEFIDWAQKNRPKFIDIKPDGFILYAISGVSVGGSGTWVAVNNEWELHFLWTSSQSSWFLIRHMGEKEPAHCFVEDNKNNSFTEIKTSDYLGEYSHVW